MLRAGQEFVDILAEDQVRLGVVVPEPVVHGDHVWIDRRRRREHLLEVLLHELAGVRQPELPSPPENPRPVDANRAVGTYRCSAGDWVVRVDADGRAWVRVLSSGEDDEELELVALNEDTLITLAPQEGRHVVYGLGDADAAGRAQFLRLTGRAVVRDLVSG